MSLLVSLFGTALANEPNPDLTATPLTSDGEPIHAPKSQSGALAETDPALLDRTDSTPVSVFVKLDYDAVASYAGGIDGLAPTSPEVTGKSLDENQAAVDAYLGHLASEEAQVEAAIESTVPQATATDSFQLAYGGIAAVVPANRIGDLLAVEGVVAVQENKLEQPLTDATPDFIGATEAWSEISDSTTAGEGVIVGLLDTGIWPEHPSLADNGIDHPGGTYGCEFGDGSDPDLGDPFTCNDKLIGAYAFVDTYLAFGPAPLEGEFCNDAETECSARDANGHGTHTATTAAGSHVEEVDLLGVDRGPISGIAPGAHVIAYRVCLNAGCFQADSVAAVEQAIADGVDVLNFSISGGSSAYTDAVELAFLDAYAAGILVNASAGNSGPGAGTADHAGPWTNTVGASTSDRHFLTTVGLSADGGASLDLTGATVTAGVDTPADVILAEDVPGYDDPLCQEPLPADSAVGQVVACERGVIARVDKSRNVLPSGAAGMILYNLDPANGTGLNTDNHFLPSVHIDVAEGEALLAFMEANSNVQARWDGGTATEVPGDVMAGFSSRGPVGDFLKPDVTAPGVQILAGNTPEPVGEGTGVPGQLYQAIQGTSMSSPHSAGVSALVKAAHPDWSPGQVKSALMTSSVQSVLKEDGSTDADPFDRGAGSIRANRAIAPTITFDVDADDYYASAADPLGRLHLNLPSIYADPMPGAVSTDRTLTNVSGSMQRIHISATAPSGASIRIIPNRFNLAAGASREIDITIDGTDLADGMYFGEITLDAVGGRGDTDAVIPVAFNKVQGGVTLDHQCDPTELVRRSEADCSATVTNFTAAEAQASLVVSTTANRNRLEIRNVGAPGLPVGNGFTWSGTLAPASAPGVESMQEGGGQPYGYLPMASLGVTPEEGYTDETLANYDVPTYLWGTEEYTSLAVTSNGYLVVGGGESEDLDCCDPQTFPDPARPNNVLAPFWTDLNPEEGGNIYVALVTDGVEDWIVVEWEDIAEFGDAATTYSFQVWINLGNEEITYTYGLVEGDGTADGLSVGAENRDGTSGVNLGSVPAAGDQYAIVTSPPEAGGSVTIPYEAFAHVRGTYEIVARMTSNVQNGVTTEVVTLTVR